MSDRRRLQLGTWGGAAVLLGLAAATMLGVRTDPAGASTPEPPSALRTATPPAHDGPTDVSSIPGAVVRRGTIGRGGSLGATLRALDVPAPVAGRVLDAVAAEVDLRRLPAAAGVTAVSDARGRTRRLSVRPEHDRFLRIDVLADGSAAAPRWIDLPVERSAERIAGTVESSVSQALEASPHGAYLTAAFADVVQWSVDLLVDPRPGDTVRIVYEARRLGVPPADLPPFGSGRDRPGEALAPGPILAASYAGAIASIGAYGVEVDGRVEYFDAEGRPMRKAFLKSPLSYRRISSRFSHARRHPITRRVVPHHGVDFAAAAGTPVSATADGRVVHAGWDGPLGRAVKVRHGSEFVTVYGHLSRIERGIVPGAQVRQSDVVGYVGSTGRATGPHLHYTVLHGGRPIDPLKMENPAAEPLRADLRPTLEAARRRWEPDLVAAESLARLGGSPDPGRGFFEVGPPRPHAAP